MFIFIFYIFIRILEDETEEETNQSQVNINKVSSDWEISPNETKEEPDDELYSEIKKSPITKTEYFSSLSEKEDINDKENESSPNLSIKELILKMNVFLYSNKISQKSFAINFFQMNPKNIKKIFCLPMKKCHPKREERYSQIAKFLSSPGAMKSFVSKYGNEKPTKARQRKPEAKKASLIEKEKEISDKQEDAENLYLSNKDINEKQFRIKPPFFCIKSTKTLDTKVIANRINHIMMEHNIYFTDVRHLCMRSLKKIRVNDFKLLISKPKNWKELSKDEEQIYCCFKKLCENEADFIERAKIFQRKCADHRKRRNEKIKKNN